MALTWRNVDAPDFRASMDGYRTFSNLLGDAFGGLERGLNNFDASIDKRVNSQFGMDLLKYQDPAAYKAALASGSLFEGVDPRRISAGNIQAASGRVGDLLNQATAEENLDFTRYNRDRTKGFNAAEDAAAPGVQAYLANAAKGMVDPTFGKGLSFAARAGLAKDAQGFERGAVDIAGGRISNAGGLIRNEADRFNLDTSKTTYAEQRAASEYLATLPYKVDNAADLEQAFNDPKFQALPGTVQLAIRNGASSFVGAPSGGGSGGIGSSGGDPTRVITSGGAGNLGIGSVPDSVQNLGQAVEFGKSLNNRGQESSAMGLYQITQSTMSEFAPKALGANWQSQPFDAQTQDAVAKKIFESTGGDPKKLMGRWTSLSATDAQRIAKLPWEQARAVISRGESGADIATLRLGSRAAQMGVANTVGKAISANPSDLAFAKASLDTATDVTGAVDSLIGKGGAFAGTNRGVMTDKIREVTSKAGVTPALAAEMIKNSVVGNDNNTLGGLGRRLRGGSPNLGNGVRIDDKILDATIARAKSGDLIRGALVSQTNNDALGAVAPAQDAYEQAVAAYQARLARKEVKPSLSIEREARALALAQAKLQAAQGVAAGRADFGAAPPTPIASRPGRPSSGALIASASRGTPVTQSRSQMWQSAMREPEPIGRGDGSLLRR